MNLSPLTKEVFKVFANPGDTEEHELWIECPTSADCKTDISVVLTVKSGLDPHMINKLKDGFKSFFGYLLWPC